MNEPNIIRINLDKASRTEVNRLPLIHEGDSGIKLQLYTAEGFYADGDVVADFDTKTLSYRKTVDFYGQIEVPDELLADECCGDIRIHLTIDNYDDLDFVCYDFVMPVIRIIHYDRFEPTPPVPPVDPWPAGFDRLEYIQSEGDVYLDTEVSVRDWDMNFRLTLLCEIFGTGMNGIGSYSSNYDWSFWCPSKGVPSYMRSTYGASNWGTYPDEGQKGYRFMDASNGLNNFGYTIGFSSFAEYADSEGYPNAKGNIYIFAGNHWKDDTPYNFLRERVYEIQFRNSTTWADFTDMYPVRRKRDGAIGFYSVAERKFLTAKGAGRFLPGPTLPYDIILPSDYQKVLYIESNNVGRTGTFYPQCVDTGVPFDDITKIRIEEDFNIIALAPGSTYVELIGSDHNGGDYHFLCQDPRYWDELHISDVEMCMGSSGNRKYLTQVDNKALLRLIMDGYNGRVGINDIYESCVCQTPASIGSVLASSSQWGTTPTIPVFACRHDYSYVTQYTDTRVYRFRIYDYDLGAYRIDLIPCYRKSDHQPGFYDIVNNMFRYDEQNASVGVYATIGETYD